MIYLNIGTNLGDKATNLYKAIMLIEHSLQCECTLSDTIESEPWGYESTNTFLNIGVALNANITPEELLDKIHQIEQHMGSTTHRNESGEYIDRLIDIDIIAIDNMVINTPQLKIPHPELSHRPFVYLPLKQLATPILYEEILLLSHHK
ncbi:MAG: 2-amino-4-hydroxy-6-hydroxymethyldihydropteridine diphosphokinase [Bacteroidales bacterium]